MSPRHPRRSERDDETSHITPRAARRRAARRAAVELHIGEGARQADRHQFERDDQAGGAGAAAARRRAADQPEPAGIPATAARRSRDATGSSGGGSCSSPHPRRRRRPRSMLRARSAPSASATTATSGSQLRSRPPFAVRSQASTFSGERSTAGLRRAAGVAPGRRNHRRLPAARARRAWAKLIMLTDGAWRRRASGQPAPDRITAAERAARG